MALDVKGIDRVFQRSDKTDKNLTLADPNPEMSPEAVMNFYANTYPELTTATIEGPKIKDGKAVYTFKTTLGEKG